jgi:hypothetical protein
VGGIWKATMQLAVPCAILWPDIFTVRVAKSSQGLCKICVSFYAVIMPDRKDAMQRHLKTKRHEGAVVPAEFLT